VCALAQEEKMGLMSSVYQDGGERRASCVDGVSVRPQLANKTVLTGDLNEKHLQPTAGTVQVDKAFDCELPAYSFTVIRIRGEKVGK
jgi:hypothetical protein